MPQKIDNLLVAGRCLSAEPDAMVQLHLIPVCFATGQAAGTAAALALREKVTPRELDVGMLQQDLIGQGMDLELDEQPEAGKRKVAASLQALSERAATPPAR